MAERKAETITAADVGELRIVEGVGVAASGQHQRLAKAIEQAMSEAVLACYAKGITDPDKIRAAKLYARARVKALVAEQAASSAKPEPTATKKG